MCSLFVKDCVISQLNVADERSAGKPKKKKIKQIGNPSLAEAGRTGPNGQGQILVQN